MSGVSGVSDLRLDMRAHGAVQLQFMSGTVMSDHDIVSALEIGRFARETESLLVTQITLYGQT